jgi:serine/threonine-protein kinase HipA
LTSPQAHLPNDGEVALAVGGEYRHAAIAMSQLVAEGDSWGLATAAALAEETVAAVLQLARTETPHGRAHSALVPDIVAFTREPARRPASRAERHPPLT